MPSVTHSESPTLASGKKRRRDDEGEVQMPFTSASQFNASQNRLALMNNHDRLIFHQAGPSRGTPNSFYNLPRKIIPLSANKRARISDENGHDLDNDVSPHGHPRSSHHHSTLPVSVQVQSHITRPTATRTNSSSLLSACHICHRRPSKKSDLDSFADCEGCGQRTCFVCIRACQGWLPPSYIDRSTHTNMQDTPEDQNRSASFTMHDVDNEEVARQLDQTNAESGGKGAGGWNGNGHRSRICSGCCVEQGSEGDVVCLGCLAVEEGL
ncbi:uncharacterized protein BCR38DRAFT_170077 [Pseudomassariella vexata]|uniref:Uncharacterized protein n=1 Tax=Pseudomassariella vexata TaxID=1141098 RepID=A0A1Y2E339_9PEZI|nr:uncharacterized protein BCR38DRAFT_170077 [Pseudomassariella vexata]ORY65953.1 hypothetical protein BCR38DRAFT_170077 [Pseudomassariella vexata]